MADPAPLYEYVSLGVVPPSPTKVMDPWSSVDGERDPMCKWCFMYAGFLILLCGVILLIAEFTLHIF
jgi:hypothetical protein